MTLRSTADVLMIQGPSRLDLLKSLPAIQSDTLGFIDASIRRYGDLVRFNAGPYTAFLVNHPDGIKHVLQDNHRNYTKRTFQYQALSVVTGQGLLTSDGDLWLSQRRLIQPAFSRPSMGNYISLMVDSTQGLIERWDKLADSGVEVDIEQEMLNLALEILGKAFFGVDLSAEAPLLTKAAQVALDTIMARTKNGINWPDFIPTRQNLHFKQALRDLDRAVADLVAGHRTGASADSGLLSVLSAAVDHSPDPVKTLRQVRDELVTLLIAGHETVASALTWSCYLLSQNPQRALTLRDEVRASMGDNLPDAVSLDQTGEARRIFDETLRLYPPAWLITRRAVGEDQILGARILPGATIMIGVRAAQRNPAFWPDPDTFNPDRFSEDQSDQRPRFAYLPFGGGPRLCIGNYFALLEAQVVLSMIFRRFRLELSPGSKVEIEALVTLRPRHGLPMRIYRA